MKTILTSINSLSHMDSFWIRLGAFGLAAVGAGALAFRRGRKTASTPARTSPNPSSSPTAVNFHFTRECNYECGFCFHTEITSDVLPLEDAKRVITELHGCGFTKINFAGGEPFTRPALLGDMCRHAKGLGMKVSIISNGSKIKPEWFDKYATYVDILGISCDSGIEQVNRVIGRRMRGTPETLSSPPKHTQLEYAQRAADLCRQHGIMFKLNTVVCAQNMDEDMCAFVAALAPARWKLFEVLPLEGENTGTGGEGGAPAKRDVSRFLLPPPEAPGAPTPFQEFVTRHRVGLAARGSDVLVVPEDNATMRDSYVLVDEHGCFLSSSGGAKRVLSAPIHEVGGAAALAELLASGAYNAAAFHRRDGAYFQQLPPRSSAGSPCAGGGGGAAGGGVVDMEDIGPALAAATQAVSRAGVATDAGAADVPSVRRRVAVAAAAPPSN